MTRILFAGQKPETVDFSDPALPPGFDADQTNAGIAITGEKIRECGWQGDTCMITPDAAGGAMLKGALCGAEYDCVVIGVACTAQPKSAEKSARISAAILTAERRSTTAWLAKADTLRW